MIWWRDWVLPQCFHLNSSNLIYTVGLTQSKKDLNGPAGSLFWEPSPKIPQPFWLGPFPFISFCWCFSLCERTWQLHILKELVWNTLPATTTKRRGGRERDNRGEINVQIRGVLKNGKQERIFENKGVQNKFSVVHISRINARFPGGCITKGEELRSNRLNFLWHTEVKHPKCRFCLLTPSSHLILFCCGWWKRCPL